MRETPLLLKACQAGSFGKVIIYDDGMVYEAGFIYLRGKPNAQLLDELEARWKHRMFICLSEEWERALVTARPELHCITRYQMASGAIDRDALGELARVPDGYRLYPFGETEYALKPFHHGTNYESYADFKSNGSGAVVWHGEEIVSSASSYLTLGNDVELDVSTLAEYRRLGLGLACAAAMLLDCDERGLRAHWDAQTPISRAMAEKLGYTLDYTYKAYSFYPVS